MDHLVGITRCASGDVTAYPRVTPKIRAISKKEDSSSIAGKMKKAQKGELMRMCLDSHHYVFLFHSTQGHKGIE